MKVSIVIPIYNVEKYLQRCVQSVFEQTYKDIEIILVDDGTKDDSGLMCDDYALYNEKIKVIHKENGGLSSARNVGMEMATGEAIFFLDSDDYISEECISKQVKLLQGNSADISIIQMKYIPENVNETDVNQAPEKIKVMTAEKAIEESLYQKLYTCSAPGKLYRRSVIGDIKFPVGYVSEDLATCHLFLNNAQKIVYSSYYGLYYRQHELSIMHTFNSKRLDALKWTREIEKFCLDKYPGIMMAAYCRSFNVAIHLILDFPDQGQEYDEYFNEIWAEVKRTRMKTLLNWKSRKREKAAAVLSFGGAKLLKKVWNSKFAVKH